MFFPAATFPKSVRNVQSLWGAFLPEVVYLVFKGSSFMMPGRFSLLGWVEYCRNLSFLNLILKVKSTLVGKLINLLPAEEYLTNMHPTGQQICPHDLHVHWHCSDEYKGGKIQSPGNPRNNRCWYFFQEINPHLGIPKLDPAIYAYLLMINIHMCFCWIIPYFGQCAKRAPFG